MPYRLSIPGQVSEYQLRAIELVATLVPEGGCVVEVGSLFGRSSWAWAQSVPPTATVVCVDPWSGNEGAHHVGAEADVSYGYEAFARYTADCPNIVPVRAFSPDGIAWNRPIDCYYEDAVHTDPVLSKNIGFWSRFLRPAGVLCGDDYRPRFPDVRASAERMARELDRALITVDFFWCLLPDEGRLPEAAAIAAQLRALSAEAAAEKARTPAQIQIIPLLPPPAQIAVGRPREIPLRITNEGGQPWPDEAGRELQVRATVAGAAAGTARALSIPLRRTQILPDDSIPFNLPVLESDASGAVLDLACSLSSEPDSTLIATWRHRIVVDGVSGAVTDGARSASDIELGEGWANAGDATRWAIGFRSRLIVDVPAAQGGGIHFLNMILRPYVAGKRETQRLVVEMGGRTVMAGCFSGRVALSIPIADAPGSRVPIVLIHPDAHRPVDSDSRKADTRTLGFALESATWSAERPAPAL